MQITFDEDNGKQATTGFSHSSVAVILWLGILTRYLSDEPQPRLINAITRPIITITMFPFGFGSDLSVSYGRSLWR